VERRRRCDIRALRGCWGFRGGCQTIRAAGAKPFWEVAQDEIHTVAELCKMQEGSRRENGWWNSLDVTGPTPTRDLEAPVARIARRWSLVPAADLSQQPFRRIF
jgi:hypothetical protein